MGSRAETRTNESIVLMAIYRDTTGDLIDPDTPPSIYIYDSNVADETREAEVEAETYTSALAGPLTSVRQSQGFYSYTYTVPSGTTNDGTWTDVWVATIDTVNVSIEQYFEVVLPSAVGIETQNLARNQLVVIQLDSTIADTSGNTLGADQVLYFLTELLPYYASTNMVRTCVGPAIDYIDDITLALLIHMSSKEADFFNTSKRAGHSARLQQALTNFVVCDASLKAISLARQTADGSDSATGYVKSLGSFSIESNPSSSTGVDKHIERLIDKLTDCKEDWIVVIQYGGLLAPGMSPPEAVAQRSIYHRDRRSGGREWVDPLFVRYGQPLLNDKSFFFGTDKQYQHYTNTGGEKYPTHDYVDEEDI